MYDMMTAFEQDLNKQVATKHLKVQFIFVPTSRDRLIPDLIAGKGDINAADLTVTPERNKLIELTNRPFGEDDFKFTTNQVFTIYPDGWLIRAYCIRQPIY